MKHLILTIICFFSFANSGFAQDDDRGFLTRKIEEALAGAGREVRITGFKGVLTSTASFDMLTIADDEGIWLTLNDVALDWQRTALLRGRFEVKELSAKSMNLARLPESAAAQTQAPTAEAQGFSLPELPVSINIEAFSVEAITLGSSLLGEPVELSVKASARLEDAVLALNINALRTDQKMGNLVIEIDFDQSTETLHLNLKVVEDKGGIAARMLDLPGQPEIDLAINGTGQLRDFVAQISLASDGVPRLTGQVELSAQPNTDEESKPTRRIQADLSGDIAALLTPDYQPFFGDNIALNLDVVTGDDGSIDVRDFGLNAQQVKLNGKLRLNRDLWPVFMDIDAVVQNPQRTPILLPVGSTRTLISNMDISVQYDAATGERLDGVFDLQDFDRDGVKIGQARIELTGTLQGEVGSVRQLLADVKMSVQDLELENADFATAIGSELNVAAQVNYIEDQPVRLSGLTARGSDYGVSGDVILGVPGGGMNTRLNIQFMADDLGRFAGLAGQDLAGAARVSVVGSVAPLAGTFDLKVNGAGEYLNVGQAQVDQLLAGTTLLNIDAARTIEGTELRRFKISNNALEANAKASLSSGKSNVRFDAKLRDLALLAPDHPGPVNMQATATEDAMGWSVDVAADGPYAARVELIGRVTGPDAAAKFNVELADISVFVPEISGPVAASGDLRKLSDGWQVKTSAQGPAGSEVNVAGVVADTGDVDLALAGSAPLGLAAPFLKPRDLQGKLTFDLVLRGPPVLSSLTGKMAISNAVFSDPNLRLTLGNIVSSVELQNQVAVIDMTGALTTGGKISVSGPVQLIENYTADLGITLAKAVFVDPSLYKTTVDAAISVKGALLGGATISGKVDVGDTEISVPASGATSIEAIPDIQHIGASGSATQTRERAGLIREEQVDKPSRNSSAVYPLDIAVIAPRIFVRGRGLDAELGGKMQLRGTTAALVSSGRFDLVRGRLDLLAQRFTLDEGEIQMQGSLLPYIRFVSSTETSDFTAKIVIEGPVNEPEVSFESNPDAPEDEILAQILFGRDISEISAFQALRLANAVALLAGSGGVSVVSKLRSGFGLDNLDINTEEDGTTEITIGKYLTDEIYTDFTAGSDGKNEVSLNIDLTPSFTAKGSVDDEGDSAVGLFFERDY